MPFFSGRLMIDKFITLDNRDGVVRAT